MPNDQERIAELDPFPHIGKHFRQREQVAPNALRPEGRGTISVDKAGRWMMPGGASPSGPVYYRYWWDIIEECAPSAEGAFECRPDTVLRWDGRELKQER